MIRPTLAENLALTMLARDGIAAIWQLHLAAAEAHRTGHRSAAASISEIAEAGGASMAEGRRIACTAVGRPHGSKPTSSKTPYWRSAYRSARSRAFVSLTINFRALR